METLKRIFHQFRELFQSMTPSQRGTLLLVPTMLVAAFGFLLFSNRSSSYIPLSWGKVFTTDELAVAEQSLRDGGLNDFRRDGQRIMVPRSEAEHYNAALLEGGTLPSGWASELEKQFASDGIFTSDKTSQARKDIAVARALELMIRGAPDIQDAKVIIGRSKPSRWRSSSPTVTSTVSIRPRGGRELSMSRVNSLRAAVASAIGGLRLEDVVILDQHQMKAYTQESGDDAFNSGLLRRIDDFSQMYQRKIYESLSYIPGVLVAVNVDVDNLKSSAMRQQTMNPKGTVALQTTEQKSTRQSSRARTSAEPGAVSNQSRQLATHGGGQQTESSNDSNTVTVSAASWKIEEQELIGAMPKAVQVSVAVPEEYFRKVAEKQAATEGDSAAAGAEPATVDIAAIKAKVEADVRATVQKAIGNGATEDSVHFNTYVRVEPDSPEIQIPLTEKIGTGISQWGGTAGLAFFALWALWMLNKSMPKLPEVDPEQEAMLAVHAPIEQESDEPEVPEETPRDGLQTVVRDNPEMTAAVLGKWLQTSK